ncbi:peptidylprolyl isomerase [Desulfuromonas versatilis]|uniref:Peptidylprolyl isomerase n=1 Tax=Desulfuromonas versatilis TaxID=2802975 RepID=A0ABM8HUW7_9BACT|nr:peptidylprolyl isomerase [Desulfuromonas versatilis]BCR05774.1 peptidylprolyl isomerase [Desulfuromonas versatilis]
MSLPKCRLLLTALVLLSVVSVALAQESAEGLVAKVGGVPVTRFELQQQVQKVLPMQVGFHGRLSEEKLAEIKQKALDELIEQAYKVQYAIREEIAVDNAAVQEALQPIIDKYGSEQGLQQALGKVSLQDFRAVLYRQLLAAKAEKLAIDDKVKVSDEEVAAFYRKHQEGYVRPRQFKASHILVKVNPSSNAEERAALKKRAEELAAKAKAGEDFYNLAYYNSDDRSKYVGGDLGYFHEGQTVAEFEAALKKLKAGEISDPVKTMYGFHIIKLVEVNESRQLGFEEVAGKIRQTLESGKRKELYEAWLAGLEKQYAVEKFNP